MRLDQFPDDRKPTETDEKVIHAGCGVLAGIGGAIFLLMQAPGILFDIDNGWIVLAGIALFASACGYSAVHDGKRFWRGFIDGILGNRRD